MEEQDYILFEDYSSGELSKEETTAFEARLQTDQAFKTAFETYKQASSFLEHELGNEEENIAFKDNLKSISDTYFEEKSETKSVKRINFYKYAIAASVVLLLGYFTFNQFSNPTYSDFAGHENISLTVRGNQNDLKLKAEEAFNSKNYKEAEAYFNQLLIKEDSNQELQFYKGVALLEQDKFSESEVIFKALAQGNSVYKNKAIWYLALSKLKQKDYKQCIEVLKTIPSDAEDYEQAQKLLKKLD